MIMGSARDGLWVDAGSGTGMAAIPMALCGRRIVGIEKERKLLDISSINLSEINWLTNKTARAEFIEGVLPGIV